MNHEAESIASELRCWLKLRDKVITTLAKKNLSDRQRRSWIRVFKQFSRAHREILYAAD
jgi:hypothetical protein